MGFFARMLGIILQPPACIRKSIVIFVFFNSIKLLAVFFGFRRKFEKNLKNYAIAPIDFMISSD